MPAKRTFYFDGGRTEEETKPLDDMLHSLGKEMSNPALYKVEIELREPKEVEPEPEPEVVE